MKINVGCDAISNTDWDLDPLDRIVQMRNARDYLDIKIEEAVREARTETRAKGTWYDHVNGETRQSVHMGLASWDQIASALGVSRQAAHRKYASLI